MVRNYKRKTTDRWSKEDLLEALMGIKNKKFTINEAARMFGISRATLYRQYNKFIASGAQPDVGQFKTCGGNSILNRTEELILEKTILELRAQGHAVTSQDIKRICFEYVFTNQIPHQFSLTKRLASDDWFYGFLKRHPAVRVKPVVGKSKKTETVIDSEPEPGTILEEVRLEEVMEQPITLGSIKTELEEEEEVPSATAEVEVVLEDIKVQEQEETEKTTEEKEEEENEKVNSVQEMEVDDEDVSEEEIEDDDDEYTDESETERLENYAMAQLCS